MKRCRMWVALIGVLCSMPIFAQDAQSGAEENAMGTQELKRQDKTTFGVGVEGGLILGGVAGGGLNVFYPVVPDWHLGLEYLTGTFSFDETGPGQTEANAELNVTLVNVYARWFVWESFNLFFGIGQRLVDYEIEAKDADETNVIKVTGDASSTNLNFGLSNIWTFGFGMYIGAEWIAYMQPIASGSSSSVETEGDVTAAQDEVAEDAKDLSEFLGEAGTTQLLMFNIGYVF